MIISHVLTNILFSHVSLLFHFQSHLLHMFLHNMNEKTFAPHKDYTANRLKSGILQLAEQTSFIIDETKLEAGQLDTTGKGYSRQKDLGGEDGRRYIFLWVVGA